MVGTRPSGTRSGVTTRTDAASTRRRVYTRPSSTRVGSSASGVQGSSSRVHATGVRRSAAGQVVVLQEEDRYSIQ